MNCVRRMFTAARFDLHHIFGRHSVRFRKQLFLMLLLTAACTSAGCRSGVSAHGHSMSMFLVPMYKQPVGFSSTYKEHLTMTPQVIEYTVGEVSGETLRPIAPTAENSAAENSTAPSDKVVFPQPCGPECRRPPADGQRVSVRSTPVGDRATERYGLITPQ